MSDPNPTYPAPIGTYSALRWAGSTAYISGQIPLDPATGDLVAGDRPARIRRAFRNLLNVAAANGLGPDDIVKVNVYLTDLAAFAEVNAAMTQLFPNRPYPARAAVEVANLPKGADIEVEAQAYRAS